MQGKETAVRHLLIAPLTAAALAAPAVSAPSPLPSPNDGPKCPFERARSPDRAEFKRLGDLPPANQYLAVYRLIDGCRADIILARGIGAAKQRQAMPRR